MYKGFKVMDRLRLLIASCWLLLLMACGDATATSPVNSAANVTPKSEAIQPPNMAYPGASRLNLNEKELWPTGRPNEYDGAILGAFSTQDAFQKVIDFYKQKLIGLGYKLEGGEPCDDQECNKETRTLSTTTDKIQIAIGILTNAGLQNADSLPASLKQQIKPGQTLILQVFRPIIIAPTSAAKPTIMFTPTPFLPSTPIKGGAMVYLGSDNHFYPDNNPLLVAIRLPAKIKAQDKEVFFQINWLVSSATTTQMQVTMEGSSQQTIIASDKIGVLTDESGHEYKLSYNTEQSTGNSTTTTREVIWQAPALPATVRQVTFSPGAGIHFKLEPLKLRLADQTEANLPRVTALTIPAAEQSGVKMRVLYAYFGLDRTVLLFNLNLNGLRQEIASGIHALNPIQYNQANAPSLTVTDDRGQLLKAQTVPGPTPVGGPNPFAPLYFAKNGDLLVVLEPVASGVKNLEAALTLTSYLPGSWQVSLPVITRP